MRLVLSLCLAATLLAPAAPAQDLGPFPRKASHDARAEALARGFQASTPPPPPVRAVAEFERSQAVVVSYSSWIGPGDELPVDLIARLSEHVRVISLHNRSNQRPQIEAAYQSAGAVMDNIEFFQTPTDSPWTRDYGPFYVASGTGGPIGIVDFIYDVASRDRDNTMPSALAGHLNMPLYTMDLVHTGGNYMTTGAGSAASTDRLTVYNDDDEARVRQQMQDYLGIETYHIVPDPQDTYIDHIDTWAKFLNVDTILIAEADPGHPDYAALEALAAQFAETESPWGWPYEVVRVYAPDRQPYTNSLIVNEHVYVATGRPGDDPALDAAALQTYRDAMPGYTVHGIDYDGWLSTDALHCRTKEVADPAMLSLRHTPLPETVPAGEPLALEAEIIAHSGAALTPGSLRLVYTLEGQSEVSVPLEPLGGTRYGAALPPLEPGTAGTYVLTASDASGRTETFPFVGFAAPRAFTAAPFVAGEAGPDAALRLDAAPNPVRGRLAVRFETPAPGPVTLDVVDALGRTVARLADGEHAAGAHRADWTPDVAPGVYLVRLTAGGARSVQRVTVAR